MKSIPVVGTWVSFTVFGGPFPGHVIIGRFYIAHVLLMPGILLALIAAHLALVVRQKHTQFPGPGRTENTVTGERVFPVYAAKAGGFFFIVFAACARARRPRPDQPGVAVRSVQPRAVSSGSQPDWYMMFLDGSTRLFPSWEIRLWGHTSRRCSGRRWCCPASCSRSRASIRSSKPR